MKCPISNDLLNRENSEKESNLRQGGVLPEKVGEEQ